MSGGALPRSHRLQLAGELGDKHIGRNVKVGTLTGKLVAIIPRPGGGVELELRVGSNEARAWVPLNAAADVEVWRA